VPSRTFWLETLGCAKNEVDSSKLAGLLLREGYSPAADAAEADLVVVNTCAFIEPAREESVDAVLGLAGAKKRGARLVVTGCLAERYGRELADALPEVDQVAGFGEPFWEAERDGGAGEARAGSNRASGRSAGSGRAAGPSARVSFRRRSRFDLLNLPRPPAEAPWAYVKIAEGCDRRCGFCAIPSFRGRQRSRSRDAVLAEVSALGVEEVVLIAQDPVSWGRDLGLRGATVGAAGSGGAGPAGFTGAALVPGPGGLGSASGPAGGSEVADVSGAGRLGTCGGLASLVRDVRALVERVRLLYLYPSGLTDELVETLGEAGCPYFDLSLQHVSRPLLRRMRRYGDGERFLERIGFIRRRFPEAALRSSFIIGYPGETEEDHELLMAFLQEAQLDWAGFFAFSYEEGTYATGLGGQVAAELVAERLKECSELQDSITAARRGALVGTTCRALVDRPGEARSHREAPEIDGTILVPPELVPGSWVELAITGSFGPDLVGAPVSGPGEGARSPAAGPRAVAPAPAGPPPRALVSQGIGR